MPPAASPAIQSILATLDLATKFAFIIVVGPDGYPELARWSLAVHLAAMGQEVLWHSLADADLDLPALLERASSANPVASGIEALSPEHRHARFARMNLERDVWGQFPVRVVLWCSTEHIDRLQHLAPDLFHWRSLIQPLTAPDLCVFDRTTYLAWLADDCAERSDDRVRRGGHMLLRDPLVVPMAAKDRGGGVAVPFSRWVQQHRRGLLHRAHTHDPRYPAKDLVRRLALRRLKGHIDSPYPLILSETQLHALASMTLSLGPVRWTGAGWRLIEAKDHEVIIFTIVDGSLPSLLSTLALEYPHATWIAIGDGDDSWWTRRPGWDHGIALADIDAPRLTASGEQTLSALAKLLRAMFAPRTLIAVLTLLQGKDFSRRLREATGNEDGDLMRRAAELLLTEGRISTEFFANLRALRPRHWQDIARVEQMFIDLAEQDKTD